MGAETSGTDFKDLLASVLPGAVITPRASSDPDGSVIEHMYKQRESVFGAVARDMVTAGWSVFPQELDGRRRPGTVNGEMIKWSEEHQLATRRPAPAVLDQWCSQCAHLNVAVVLGPASGHTFVIDVDVTEEELSAKIQEIAAQMLGETPLRRVGNWPKIALVYRHAPDDEVRGRSPKFATYDGAGNVIKGDQGLEIISSGQAMTFYGKHHRTGRYFHWLEGPPHVLGPEKAPLVTSKQIDDFLDAVDSIRPFHRATTFETSAIEWEWDENAKIHVPRVKASGAATNWVENEEGIVVDGRENYLNLLVHRIVTANQRLAADPVNGVRMLVKVTLDRFAATAEMSGRWRGRSLEREIKSKVERTAAKVREGRLKAWEPGVDAEGRYLPSMQPNFVPHQPRKPDRESLDFLPPFVNIQAASFDPKNPKQRRPIRCRIIAPEDGAEQKRAIRTDRADVARSVSEGLENAFRAFWDEVYAETVRSPRIHILKAPTGAGKTSKGIQFIATDPRTKENYAIHDEEGAVVHEGRAPIVFLLPTYANIDELRARAEVLNLDPSLPDNELRAQAAEMNLIHEDELEDKLAELRRDARRAGLRTMVYRGKIKAGCKMAEKVKLAMEAGLGTSGFCKAEVPTDRTDENGKTIMEEKFCPYYGECEAIRQKEEISQSHVVFAPHAFLSLQIPEELKHVRAVVADERIHHLFLHTTTFKLSSLFWPRKPPKLTKAEKEEGVRPEEIAQARQEAVNIVNMAFVRERTPQAQCPVEALARCKETDNDGTPSAVRWVKAAIRMCQASIQRDGSITPDLTLEQVKEICAQPTGQQVREELRFWKIVLERLEQRISEIQHEKLAAETGTTPLPRRSKGDREYRIQRLNDVPGLDPEDPGNISIRISWREQPNWIDRPLLLLDASAAPEMISKIWSGKEVVVHDIPAQLNVRIVGIVDRTYSNASVVASPNASPKDKHVSAQLLNKIRKVITMLSGLYGWGRVVAGGSILVRRAVNSEWEGPHNVDWCHFGAMRGLDFAKHHAAAISVGRMELPIRTIDGLVAALTYDDDEPENPYDLLGTGLGPDNQPLRIPMGVQRIRMRSGHDLEMLVPTFPGRWGRMIQRQYREEELLQFLGRLRPVYREGDPPVWYSLSSVIPEDVVVDDLLMIDDLIMGKPLRDIRLWEVMRRSRGVFDTELAMKLCDDLYPSKRAVVEDMKAIGLDPESGSAKGRMSWGIVAVAWRAAGGRSGTAFVRADIADPEETLRNAYAEFLGIEILTAERISQSRGHTMARGRAPDKIEEEIGTPEDRRRAEAELAREVDRSVLATIAAKDLEHLRDKRDRPVPLLIPVSTDEEESGEGGVIRQEYLQAEELRAKVVVERLWSRLMKRDETAQVINLSALPSADVRGQDYSAAADHVLDGDLAVPDLDEVDHLIPW